AWSQPPVVSLYRHQWTRTLRANLEQASAWCKRNVDSTSHVASRTSSWPIANCLGIYQVQFGYDSLIVLRTCYSVTGPKSLTLVKCLGLQAAADSVAAPAPHSCAPRVSADLADLFWWSED